MYPKKSISCFVIIVALAVSLACAPEQPGATPTPAINAARQTPQADAGSQPVTNLAVARQEAAEYTHQSLATGSPGMNSYGSSQPGQSTKLDRAFPGAPPQIPHAVDGLTITKDSNSCMGCHSTGVELSPGHAATRIPESHYTDLQTGQTVEKINGQRYACLSCHVPQSPEEPVLGRGN